MIRRGAWLGLLLVGCLNPVDVESAYDREIDLCADEYKDELARRVAACRRRWERDPNSCAGVVSFSGRLQGALVVVDSELRASRVKDVRIGDAILRDSLDMLGDSPYFEFELAIDGLGGAANQRESHRELAISPAVASGSAWYDDGTAQLEFNLSAGTRKEIQLVRGSLQLDAQGPDEHVGTFSGENAAGDSAVGGCFHAFTTSTRLTVEER